MKKIFSLFIALIICLSVFSLSTTASGRIPYAAFGDSISAGYGLDNQNYNYVKLIEKEYSLRLVNYSETGMDSAGLLALLNTSKCDATLKNAQLVTVSIGSNDLLQPLVTVIANIADILGVDFESPTFFEDIQKRIESLMTDPPSLGTMLIMLQLQSEINGASARFNEGVSNFKANFPQIINKITAKAPEAAVLVNNIYNPVGDMDFGDTGFDIGFDIFDVDNYISQLNEVIKNTQGIFIINLYDSFMGNDFTEISAGTGFDPHPNQKGHENIFELCKTALLDHEFIDPYPHIKAGDINGDGKVNGMDLLLIKQHILDVSGKKLIPGSDKFIAADINLDGVTNGMDLLLLKKMILS